MGQRNACFDISSAELIQRAAREMPRDLGSAVRSLITVSCTHVSSPGLEQPVLQSLQLSPNVHRWHLGFMGCSAGLAALRLVHEMNSSAKPALIVACELSSLHFQYSDEPDQITANMLFSDGAVLVSASSQPGAIEVIDSCCVTLPHLAGLMTWFADDHGLRLKLARTLPVVIGERLPAVVEEFLSGHGFRRNMVDFYCVHPGGPQILDCVESALNLQSHDLVGSRDILRDYGNMSSTTIYFILKRLWEQRVNGLCLAMAFGPGLTIELALLDINHRRG